VELELNEAVAARPRDDASKGKGPVRPERPRTAMWISLAATGAFGIGAGVFALLAQDAKRDFEHQLGVFPTTRAEVEDARSTLRRNAAITDALVAATVVGAGFTVYFALATGGSKESAMTSGAPPRPPPPRVGIAPTLGGAAVVGSF